MQRIPFILMAKSPRHLMVAVHRCHFPSLFNLISETALGVCLDRLCLVVTNDSSRVTLLLLLDPDQSATAFLSLCFDDNSIPHDRDQW
jgi:hypothetical protein